MFHVPHQFRVHRGALGSDNGYGNNGAFRIPKGRLWLEVIASDEFGWEHVSVSLRDRCPTWDEMCFIKDLFWDDTDCVVQYHPPKAEYVSHFPFCLHLWKMGHGEFPQPSPLLVGGALAEIGAAR